MAGKRQERPVYWVFDVLYLNGLDLREVLLIGRKQITADLSVSIYNTDDDAVLNLAFDLHLEVGVSK